MMTYCSPVEEEPKMNRISGLLVLALLTLPPVAACNADDAIARMEFIVAESGPGGQVLEDVEVTLLRRAGFKSLGRTNGVGWIAVKRALLEEDGALAVLFCSEWHFCGAFRLDDREFFKYDERFITLAPFAVR